MAITATARNAAAPALATAAEQGSPSLDIQSWWGLWGPRGTPPEVIARIGEVLSSGMFDADIAPRVNNMGVEPAAEPAAEFARFIQADFTLIHILEKSNQNRDFNRAGRSKTYITINIYITTII
jgi:tripartite-type tricarboxylate transporter receptor subunit TctC